MIDFFVALLTKFNNLTGNLGVTLIIIGVASRAIFYPVMKSTLRQSQVMRDLKPKLDELKKKHGQDKKRLAEEQAKLYRESGVSPAGCLAPILQLVIAIILFQVLTKLLTTGVDTSFFIWDLAKPDTYVVPSLPFKLPGVLVILTALATFVQSKMTLPEPVHDYKSDSPKEKKEKEHWKTFGK